MTFLHGQQKFLDEVEKQSPKKIALIDDCPVEHQLLKLVLANRFGGEFSMDSAYNLKNALQMLTANQYDFIFLDNRLEPNCDFTQTLPHINPLRKGAKLFIISSSIVDRVFGIVSDYLVDGLIDKAYLVDRIMNGDLLQAA